MSQPVAPFANYQYEIYLAGDRSEVPFDLDELERQAQKAMSPQAWSYTAGGASSGETLRANRAAFERWRIVPRMLRDVAQRDLSVDLLGSTFPAPVLLAPIGAQSIVHPEAELATARAAAGLGMPLVLSSVSSTSMEDVATALGDTPRWFQLYWPRDPELTRSFLARAEAAGYSAVVVTVDNALLAWRPNDLALGYLPYVDGTMANYFTDPVFRASLATPPEDDTQAAVLQFATVFSDPSLTWDDLSTLREMTSLPILVKGVLDPGDARQALDRGMDGVVVSNHGGRQVDGAIPALDALPDVVDAVDGRVPVLFDSGIRTGADGFKALALGARAVLLGRPYLWGLAVAGEAGVRQVVRSFLADLDLTFALTGVPTLAGCDRTMLRRA
jgi:lactate 2-monooxygenase